MLGLVVPSAQQGGQVGPSQSDEGRLAVYIAASQLYYSAPGTGGRQMMLRDLPPSLNRNQETVELEWMRYTILVFTIVPLLDQGPA